MSQPKTKQLSPLQIGGIAFGISLVMLLAGWFLLISPKRAEAAKLDDEIAATEQQLEATRAAALAANNVEPIRYADLFRLAKAMPDDSDHAGILLELNRVATDSGIQFDEIAPGALLTVTGFRVMPIELKFEGNFFNLSDFLYRLRNLVSVENGRLIATGRLFTVERIIFTESERGFPDINATLNVSAFLYGSAPAAAASTATTAATTTSTDTTTTTTTPAEPATPPTAAAPAP